MREGIPEDDQIPLIAAVAECLNPSSPNPIICFIGQEGSTKTSKAARIAQTIDPFNGEPPSSEHKDERNLHAATQDRYCVLLDNMTGTQKGVEDFLCRSSYGSAVTLREYYTNADALTLQLHVAWILTGIAPFLRQADTLDRALVISIEKPRQYRTESVVRAEYAAKIPDVLGGVLCLLSTSLRMRDQIASQRRWKHRMVDWAMTGEAIAQSIGLPPGHFVELMDRKRQRAASDYVEGDAFASALVKLVNEWASKAQPADDGKIPSWHSWGKTQPGWCAVKQPGSTIVAATAGAICKGIARYVESTHAYPDPRIPSTARATTGALQRVQGVLGRSGIECKLRAVNGGANGFWVFGLRDGA